MESKNTRVAHCMVCGNEWVPRDSTTKKPSRCSACRSRTVKWRDTLTADELKAHDQYDVPGVEVELPTPEPVEETEEEVFEYVPEPEEWSEPDPAPEPEPTLESIRHGFPSFPPQAYVILIAALGGIGLICFLARKARSRRPRLPAPVPEEPQYTERDLKILRQQQVDNVIRRRLAGGGQRA